MSQCICWKCLEVIESEQDSSGNFLVKSCDCYKAQNFSALMDEIFQKGYLEGKNQGETT